MKPGFSSLKHQPDICFVSSSHGTFFHEDLGTLGWEAGASMTDTSMMVAVTVKTYWGESESRS